MSKAEEQAGSGPGENSPTDSTLILVGGERPSLLRRTLIPGWPPTLMTSWKPTSTQRPLQTPSRCGLGLFRSFL